MTNCPCIAANPQSCRNVGASSSSLGVKRSVGFTSALTPATRFRSGALSQGPDKRVENQCWANVLAQDHALLRLLVGRFERAEQPRECATLLRLALDFHEMHSVFESGWVQIPALDRARVALDDLAEQIERTSPISGLHRARGLTWKEHLIDLMPREEICHREKSPRSGPLLAWPEDLLGWRRSLDSEVRAVLEVEHPSRDAAR